MLWMKADPGNDNTENVVERVHRLSRHRSIVQAWGRGPEGDDGVAIGLGAVHETRDRYLLCLHPLCFGQSTIERQQSRDRINSGHPSLLSDSLPLFLNNFKYARPGPVISSFLIPNLSSPVGDSHVPLVIDRPLPFT